MHPDRQRSTAASADLLTIAGTPSAARIYLDYLNHQPYRFRHSTTATEALEQIEQRPPDVALLELPLPDMDGLELLQHILRLNPACVVVVISADGSLTDAIKAMRTGATDFLVKPFNADRLLVTLTNAAERKRLAAHVKSLKRETALKPVGGKAARQPIANRGANPGANPGVEPLHLTERRAIEEAIRACGGNVPRAAAFLEVSPSTLYRKLGMWTNERGNPSRRD